MDISELKQDTQNFNRGTFEGTTLMEQSLKRLKAGRSILIDKENNIIAGNKTAETAEKLGYQVRVIETDGTELIAVKRTDLSLDSREGREMAIADNSTSVINLAWDEDNLTAAELNFGIDPDDWRVDLSKNMPTGESLGEIDVSTFDTNQTLKLKFSTLQYEAVIKSLSSVCEDLCLALLKILKYEQI